MKSFSHILALRCDFGAETVLNRRATDYQRNSRIPMFPPPPPPKDNVANLHYNIKTIMAVIVNMVYFNITSSAAESNSINVNTIQWCLLIDADSASDPLHHSFFFSRAFWREFW